MPVSPTVEGFRAAFRRPSLTFAEITWRWVFGATATVLFLFGLLEFLDTLPVTSGELFLLRTRNPFLVSQALGHILRGSVSRGLLSLILAALLMALLWIVAASMGRIATVEAMLEYFRTRFAGMAPHYGANEPVTETVGAPRLAAFARRGTFLDPSKPGRFSSLLRLNFLRVAVAVAGLVGLAGGAIVAGFVSSPAHPRPGLAFLLLLLFDGSVCLIWFELNWLLSMAAVFAVRDGDEPVQAISSAATLCRERSGEVFAVSTWTGLAHLVAFIGATTVASFPLALAGILPWRVVALAIIGLMLAYLAVADWLYTARLAGFVCIAEMPDALLAPPQVPIIPVPPVPSETIDRGELILSDIPNLAVET